MDKRILIDRNIDTADYPDLSKGWYAPSEYLKTFRSVVKVELWCTSSSAGDWWGYFIQKLNEISYLITFNQENNYPYAGFNLYTGSVVASCKGDFNQDTINSIMGGLQ